MSGRARSLFGSASARATVQLQLGSYNRSTTTGPLNHGRANSEDLAVRSDSESGEDNRVGYCRKCGTDTSGKSEGAPGNTAGAALDEADPGML